MQASFLGPLLTLVLDWVSTQKQSLRQELLGSKGENLKGKKQRKEKPKLVTTLRKQSLILPVPSGEAYRI